MPTANKLRKLLHRKAWEFATPCPSQPAAGSFIEGDKGGIMPKNDCIYFCNSASGFYNYNADQDAWLVIQSSGAAGSFAAGSCGEFRAIGVPGGTMQNTATAGTTTTLTTNRTLVRDIRGCKLRVVSGTGIGYDGAVASNTVGANSVITVTPASAVAFDATTVFQVWSGSLWFFNAGTMAVGFSAYDRATNTWTAKSVTNLPSAWGTCGQLISTGSMEGAFETGTSSGSNTTTTLNKATAAWPTNAYANAQVRITAGVGIGQVRVIASNTATALTISVAWTVTPDATSAFSIEGNDDALYLLGNNAVTLYKYSISANTWATVTPTLARNSAMMNGATADWINGVTDADWVGAKGLLLWQAYPASTKQNGRYIYSLRGGGSMNLDVYDIALNLWVGGAALPYGNAVENFTTGSCSVDYGSYIYIMKEATGRMFRFDIVGNVLEPWATNVYPQSSTQEGNKLIVVPYKDGATVIPFLYTMQHNRQELLRMMVID